MAELCGGDRDLWLPKPKLFSVWPFMKRFAALCPRGYKMLRLNLKVALSRSVTLELNVAHCAAVENCFSTMIFLKLVYKYKREIEDTQIFILV